MKTKSNFTLVEIMIVVAIIGILVTIALPGLQAARKNAQTKACIANLKQIQGAVVRYQTDTGTVAVPTWKVLTANKAYLGKTLECPATGKAYVVAEDPVCPDVATLKDHVLP